MKSNISFSTETLRETLSTLHGVMKIGGSYNSG